MKTFQKIFILMGVLAAGTTGMAKAQDQEPVEDSVRISPFHISLITPLGTNGLESWNTTNRISLNVFAGYSGGLKGLEVAGFANALKGDMDGIQIAGFCNNTLGSARGLEIAGYWNYNQKKLIGSQISGFANVALDTVDGIQASGFTNVAVGDVQGVQATGFANVTVGDTKGVQASGFANVTTGRHQGVQASGFVNYARSLSGVQVGVVNIADSVEKGIPIGFLSFVRHGYNVIQIGGNETLFGEISYKTGVRRFYNIFSAGSAFHSGTLRWGFGYGIGTLVPVGRRIDIGIEALSYHINEGGWFTNGLNSLSRLNLNLSFDLTNHLGIYAGGSLNVLVTDFDNGDPFEHHGWNPEVMGYAGFSTGLRVKL